MKLFLDGIQMICSLFLLRLPQCPTSYLAEGRHHGFHIVHIDFCTPIPKSFSPHFIELQPKFPVIFMDCLWLAEGGEGEEDAPHAFRPLAAPARMLSGILALSCHFNFDACYQAWAVLYLAINLLTTSWALHFIAIGLLLCLVSYLRLPPPSPVLAAEILGPEPNSSDDTEVGFLSQMLS